jgi:hypothetical protein
VADVDCVHISLGLEKIEGELVANARVPLVVELPSHFIYLCSIGIRSLLFMNVFLHVFLCVTCAASA